MPCSDITDSLKIKLDFDNRVLNYSLKKKTCQGEVGRKALLIKWIRNKNLSEIVNTSPDEISRIFPTKSKTWEYLYLKHFLALQSGLKVLSGEESGGAEDYCKVYRVEYDSDGIILEADISVNGITEQIKSCGGCQSCSS